MKRKKLLFALTCLAALQTLAADKLPYSLLISAIWKIYTVDRDRGVKWVYKPEAKKNPVILDAWALPNGHILFSHRWGVIEMTREKEIIWEYRVKREKEAELHSCQPLSNGLFLILQCAGNRLIEIDRAGKVHREIKLTGTWKNPHSRYGVARKTVSGTYLVPYTRESKVVEFNAAGKIIREIVIPGLTESYIWYAERLPNGNTLVSTGRDRRVLEVNPQDHIVWELSEKDLPGIRFHCLMGIRRLPSGNTLICNGDFHLEEMNRGEIMVMEVTPEKKIAWKLTRSDIGKTLPPEPDTQNGKPVYRTTQVSILPPS